MHAGNGIKASAVNERAVRRTWFCYIHDHDTRGTEQYISMALSLHMKIKIIYLKLKRGLSYRQIAETLKQLDNVSVSHTAIRNCAQKFISNGERLTSVHLDLLDDLIKQNPERSSEDLQRILKN